MGAGLVQLEAPTFGVVDETLPSTGVGHRRCALKRVDLLGELGGHGLEVGNERSGLPAGHVVG